MVRDLSYLIYRAKFNWRKHFEYAGDFPVHVDIELAGKCQLACTMCPYGTGAFDESKQGMMRYDMAVEAINQAAEGGASSIKFNFRGEPGLYKRLENCIRIAKARGITETAINTNLTAFTHERLEDLCDAGLDLMIISIDGATKQTYEKIRVKGNWQKLSSNLSHLLSLHNRPRIRIQAVMQPVNAFEIESGYYHEFFSKSCDELVIQKLRSNNQGERRRCAHPWQRLVVAWDGRVFACCNNWNNEWPVGEFPKQSLHDIWNSSNFLTILRVTAKDYNYGPCQNCKVGASYK
jgi:radical SAM protein with 4Fe4S-binding SPASM domain